MGNKVCHCRATPRHDENQPSSPRQRCRRRKNKMTTTAARLSKNGHAQRRHQCEQCNKSFGNAKGLLMHIGRVHTRNILAFREQLTPTGRRRRRYGPRVSTLVAEVPKRKYMRRTFIERVLERHASPNPVNVCCPQCHYDLDPLRTSAVPSQFCPGCGVSIESLVQRLQAFLSKT